MAVVRLRLVLTSKKPVDSLLQSALIQLKCTRKNETEDTLP